MIKYLLVVCTLFTIGCSSTYRPHVIDHRDPRLLFDCATPAQPEKLAEILTEKLRCQKLN